MWIVLPTDVYLDVPFDHLNPQGLNPGLDQITKNPGGRHVPWDNEKTFERHSNLTSSSPETYTGGLQ